MTFGTRLFVCAGRVSRVLPPFRGRTRVFLILYGLLRLDRRRCVTRVRLKRPVPYDAELDLHSWLQRIAFLTGGYEPDTTRFLSDLSARLGSSGYMLDVGANVGLIAIPYAKMGPHDSLRVLAVEAVPDNAAALRRNVASNGLEKAIAVLPLALGAERKIVDIQVEGDLRGGEGTGTANILPDGSTYECVRQQIEVETLDALAAAGRAPDGCNVMKIDTDGYDLMVLQGAGEFISRNRPVIFGELAKHCLGWHGQSISDVVAWAAKRRYEVWRRVLPAWRWSRDLDVETYEQDLLLVPAERSALLVGMLG